MAENEVPETLQLINGAGDFNASGLDEFAKLIELADCGLSYAVVAIMGPQSSGKSTLLNHLFKTHFVEMDTMRGRSQTTQGVWLARALGIDPCTLVLDLEGTDGRERGEDDTTFEKQSSLFALAVADVVLVNMWCHDIGREHAANKPLLKTVFQVMMRLFTPRKTTLLFVVRDKTKTPMEVLEPILREDIQKIWDCVPKPKQYADTPLSDFFQMEVTALSNFEEKEEQFLSEVGALRERFMNSLERGRLAGDRRGVVPGAGFGLSVEEIWRVIRENKDLDLPAHKVMVATVRCEQIANAKLGELQASQEWLALDEGAKGGPVTGFGHLATLVLQRAVKGYEAEAAYFEESVREKKMEYLLGCVRETLLPAHQAILGHHRAAALDRFKRQLDASTGGKDSTAVAFAEAARRCQEEALQQFDAGAEDSVVEGAGWDSSKPREKLRRDMEGHLAAVRREKLAAIAADAERYLVDALAEPATSLLDAATSDTWPALRALLRDKISWAADDLAAAIAGFEVDEEEEAAMQKALAEAGQVSVEKRAREEAAQALMHMKDRFNTVFGRDEESMPRRWSGSEDIRSITRDARSAAVRLLAVLAAIRLEESDGQDRIEAALLTLVDDKAATPGGASADSAAPASAPSSAPSGLALSAWEMIPAEHTLLTPGHCRSLWRQFKAETEYTISQAMQAQEASRRGSSWLPPPWAVVAMVVLGFNEFMALLRNPLWLVGIIVAYFLSRAVWVQLDIGNDFSSGFLPGMISLSTKLVPTLLGIFKRLVEEGQEKLNQALPHHPPPGANSTAGIAYKAAKKEIQMEDFPSSSSKEAPESSTVGNTSSSSLRHRVVS